MFYWPLQGGASFVFMFRVCHALQPCGHMPRKANLLALLYVLFTCVFVTFPRGVLGAVWYLIVSVPDLCLQYILYTLNRTPYFITAQSN